MARAWPSVVAAVTLALLALATPPGQAQAAPGVGSALALDDPAGDVRTEANGQALPAGDAAYPALDLRALAVQETPFSVAFTLSVAALAKDSDPGADGVLYDILFTHNGREFQVRLAQSLPAVGGGGAFALVSYRDLPEDDWSTVWTSEEVVLDAGANSLTLDVPRETLVDKDGAAPFPGRALESVHVAAQSFASGLDGNIFVVPFTTPQRVHDDMPDSAPYPAMPILLGLAQTGHARLDSAMPFRASNGEATTFVYSVMATNLGEAEDTFELEATSVPAGYTVVLPVPALALKGSETIEVPVLLTMPFGHQHGSVASFVLEMRSLSDAGSVGRLEIGVRFLAVPQPAGHHDTVYLHLSPADGQVAGFLGFPQTYINTLEDDPNDAGGKMYATGLSSSGASEFQHFFEFPLDPALQMGLDIDPTKTGHIRIPVGTTAPQLATKLSVSVYASHQRFGFADEDQSVLIAHGETDPVDLGAGAEHLFEADLVPSTTEDRVRYEPGRNLYLSIVLTTNGPPTIGAASEGPYIGPGASALLPLEEWHDAVDEVLASLDGPGLSPLGPQERLVNPGEAVVFPVSIANPLDTDVTVDLEVTGPNAGWASLPSASLGIAAHATGTATVVVRAPAGAVDGERADLVLQAYPRDDPTARGLLRLVAEVDTEADQADDSAVAPGPAEKGSPALGPLALAACLAGLALLRRRPA